MNKLAEVANNRVTIVKFDDHLETNCPTLASLFFSSAKEFELLTPNFSLGDAAGTIVYSEGDGVKGSGVVRFVVANATCRYVLAVKRYDRDGDVEKEIQAKDLPQVNMVFQAAPARHRDEKFGFRESTVRLIDPQKPLNFTGIVLFAPTTFTVYLANAEKDLTIASQSNFLTHTYQVEVKNAQAALRISIDKELFSNGQWANAYGK